MRRSAISAIGLLALASTVAASFQTAPNAPLSKFAVAGFEHDSDAVDFFRSFVSAVVSGRRSAVSRLVSYPVVINGVPHPVSTRGEFLRLYDRVFTPCFVRILKDAQAGELWANYRGAAMPRGQIWFSPDERGIIRVITINGPVQGPKTCELAVEREQPAVTEQNCFSVTNQRQSDQP